MDGVRYDVDEVRRLCVSCWPDGVTLTAAPNYDDESRVRAQSLGYGYGDDAVWRMTKDHDRLHHVVAQALGQPYSLHLRAIAEGKPSPVNGDAEERLVLLVQRANNLGV